MAAESTSTPGRRADHPGGPPAPGPGRPDRAGNLSGVKLLVTGGAGFIGSNYVRWVLANTDDEVTVYDALTYAGNRASLRDVEESDPDRFRFVHGDVCDLEALFARRRRP